MANEGNVQLFPRSDEYRKNLEKVKWDDPPKVERPKEEKPKRTSENFFEATPEDIAELKAKIAQRHDYAERVRERWHKDKGGA